MMKTPTPSIFFGTLPTETMDTAEMTIKLKAAEPTIVEGPSSPGVEPKLLTVSITESRISGAEEPSAINVRLAMVGFQTATCTVFFSPLESVYVYFFVYAVITSIALRRLDERLLLHENIRNDCDAQEQIHQPEEIDDGEQDAVH